MRKNIRRAILMLVLLPLPVLHACSDDITGNEGIQAKAGPEAQALPTLVVFPASLTLEPGESSEFVAILEGADQGRDSPELTFDWSSFDPEIMTVSADGWVTALGEGETMIEARYGDLTGQARVVVRR
jgi:hypothetical protein